MPGKIGLVETEKNRRELVDMHYLLTQVNGLPTPAAKAFLAVVDEGIDPDELERIVRAARRFSKAPDVTRGAIRSFVGATILENDRKEVEKDMAPDEGEA